jgi:hypothetical protein
MHTRPRIAGTHPAIVKALRVSITGAILACLAGGGVSQLATVPRALAEDASGVPAFAPAMISHMQAMRRFKDPVQSVQSAPDVIPRFELDRDPFGATATFQPGGATFPRNNPFFQNLGANGRTCFTCHQPQSGWTVSAADIASRFTASAGTDPIFRLVDGATCPSDDVSTLAARRKAYSLLTDKGLIRIGIGMPDPAILQFEVTAVDDPYDCTKNPVTGLTSKTAGIVSMYRRPLPSTNLGFLSTIMWDGRELDLFRQSVDATRGHAQGTADPSAAQQAAIVAFESGLFTAQEIDRKAGSLHDQGATGGAVALSLQLAKFFIGVNDPIKPPPNTQFDPNIFDLFKPWLSAHGDVGDETRMRRSIARGEEVFNTTHIDITDVAGLNDVLNQDHIPGFCGTCHDTPNVGDHSVKAPLNIGVANAGDKKPPVLDITGLPVFTLTCTADGPLKNKVFAVTDPGRALISGNCADIGKVKGPILRGLAARAPYFHNGSAASLTDVVNFYDERFNIGFTPQQKQDLVNFLNAL